MTNKETEWLLAEKYQGEKTADFFADLTRLEKGEPLAYVIGQIPFLSSTIWLDSKPLIPRPETEFWVENAITEIKRLTENKQGPIRVLDLCAGSGCIGVAVAKSLPGVLIDFIELEEKHLPTIEKNCQYNHLEKSKYRILQGDLFSISENVSLGKYHFILSNPPYIDPTLKRVEISVQEFEPQIALYGGKQGFEVIKQIIEAAPEHLFPFGQLWLEHEPEQIELIHTIAKPLFSVTTHNDQYHRPRFTKLVLQ